MDDGDRLLLDENETYVGPTLRDHASRKLLEAMSPLPLCTVCPGGQWYQVQDRQGAAKLECFCTQFRGVMYDGSNRVMSCDARHDLIAPASD
jgi:hypothetical protein